MNDIDRFHATAEQYQEYTVNSLTRAVNTGAINQTEADLITEFVNEIRGEAEHISEGRIFKIHYILIGCRKMKDGKRFLKVPFDKATAKDLKTATGLIKNNSKAAKNTKTDYIRFLKRFFLWLADKGYTTIPEKEIRSIKVPSLDTTTKTAEGMLSIEEMNQIIAHLKNPRDKAIVALMASGALRVGEVASLTWSQVKIEEHHCIINVSAKTETPRFVPVDATAKLHLINYINANQIQQVPDELVFWLIHGGERVQMGYAGLAKTIKIAAKEAGINKAVTPHVFRHSAITGMINDGLGESVTKLICWGNQSTNMLKTYSHLSNPNILKAVQERWGVEVPTKKSEIKKMGVIQCQCGVINAPTNKYCSSCGSGLTKEAADAVKETKNEMSAQYAELGNDPEMIREFLNFQNWKRMTKKE